MELRVLEYFLEIVNEGNMTRAAEVLHTSQSNLSRQIADLERELGCTLFERAGRRMKLTEEGLLLERRAREIAEIVRLARQDVGACGTDVAGTVRVGAVETRYMREIGSVMKALQEEHSGIAFDVFSGSNDEISERLERGFLDFGVVVAPIDMVGFDNLALGMRERFGLLVREGSSLVAKGCVEPADIDSLSVWVAHQQLEGNVLSSWLGRHEGMLDMVGTFNLISTPAMMVESGFGAAFTFEGLVNTEGLPIEFVPLAPQVTAELYLVWKKGSALTPAARVFLDALRDSAVDQKG